MKRILLTTILLLGAFSYGFARRQGQERIDSLLQQLQHAGDDTLKARLLNDLSLEYYIINPDSGIKFGMRALEVAEMLDWKSGIATAYSRLGTNYRVKSDYPLALEYYFKALKINEELKDKSALSNTLANIGNIYGDQQNYTRALEYSTKALAIDRALSNMLSVAKNLGNIGNIYTNLGNYDKALENSLEALKLNEKQGDKLGVVIILGNLGIIYHGMRNYELALEYYSRALKLSGELGDNDGVAITSGNIGCTYLAMVKDSARLGAIRHISPSRNVLLQLAIDYLQKSISMCRRAGNTQMVIEFYPSLAEAYTLGHDVQRSLDCYREYIALKDSVFSIDSKVKIAQLENQREDELKEKQRQIDQLKVEKSRTERALYITGIGLLLIGVFMTGRSYRIQKKLNGTITKLVEEQEETIKQRTLELAESNERLALANRKLLELIQYNAHNMREPLARVMGAMIIQEYMAPEEFYAEIWPQMQKAVNDLDNSIKDVIHRADETVGMYG